VTPLVSILIPAYNAERFLAETLASALAQTWPRTEIIVVDDGSTDDTLAVARRFEGPRVLVTTQANQGAAASRNNALALSQGDYVQWLDADDLLSPDKIAKQMAAHQPGDKHMLLSSPWGFFSYRPRRAQFTPTPLWCDLSPTEWLLRKLGQNLHMQTATWLVSRELTEAAGPWDTRLVVDDDGEYFCRVLLASNGVRFVPEGKVFYRRNASGVSYIGRSRSKMEAQWLSMRLHMKYLRSQEDSDRVRAACIQYMQTWMIEFYPDRLDLVRDAARLAVELGGTLQRPRLAWKYDAIRRLFGWSAAKRAQLDLRRLKWSVLRLGDQLLAQLEQRPLGAYERRGQSPLIRADEGHTS
jgi:glycosyltransferase involved in cell wall biosynthesis